MNTGVQLQPGERRRLPRRLPVALRPHLTPLSPLHHTPSSLLSLSSTASVLPMKRARCAKCVVREERARASACYTDPDPSSSSLLPPPRTLQTGVRTSHTPHQAKRRGRERGRGAEREVVVVTEGGAAGGAGGQLLPLAETAASAFALSPRSQMSTTSRCSPHPLSAFPLRITCSFSLPSPFFLLTLLPNLSLAGRSCWQGGACALPSSLAPLLLPPLTSPRLSRSFARLAPAALASTRAHATAAAGTRTRATRERGSRNRQARQEGQGERSAGRE